MLYSKARIAVAACGLAAVLFVAPSQSEGGLFDWLCPSSWGAPAPSATTYAPPYTVQRISLMPVVGAAPVVCTPVSRTCRYVPQTSYRWTYSRMAVTSYRPVTALDPCSGCATTVYQPVTRTTLLPWLHREPVTTYRLSCSDVCAPICTTVCDPCTPSFCPPSSVVGTVQTVPGSTCPAGCAPITTIPESATTADPGYGGSTFKSERAIDSTDTPDSGASGPDLRLKPSPDLEADPTSMEKPKLISPGSRTASRPFHYATFDGSIRQAARTGTASSPPLDVGGWRASHD